MRTSCCPPNLLIQSSDRVHCDTHVTSTGLQDVPATYLSLFLQDALILPPGKYLSPAQDMCGVCMFLSSILDFLSLKPEQFVARISGGAR